MSQRRIYQSIRGPIFSLGNLFALALVLGNPLYIQAATSELYVSPSGIDSNPGTKSAPLATLQAARDAIRGLRKAGSIAGGITVWIKGGDYTMAAPLELTAEDSGTAESPMIYRAVEGERPLLSNSHKLLASNFHSVTDAATLARLAAPARGKILELDLDPATTKHIAVYPDVFSDTGNIVDLFINGQRMTLSRYPDDGFMTIKRVLDNGGGPVSAVPNDSPAWTKKASRKTGGTFEYRDTDYSFFDLMSKDLEHGLWLKGFWRVMWQNEAARVKSIDVTRHTVTFAQPLAGGIGNKYHRPEGNGKEQYWALNLLQAVVRPGEWYIDFSAHKLFLFPTAEFDRADIRLADSDQPVVFMRDASHVTVQGVTVQNAMGDGIRVQDGQDDLIAGCTVRNVDKYAVVVDGGRHHTVQSCDLYNLGCGGVWLSGGDEKSNPRVPAGHRVINNHIHHFSQIVKVYTPAVNCGYVGGAGTGHHSCVGMYVAHNLIHDTPHGGILYGSWDSVFEYNEIFRYCTVSNDLGAFYSYDTYSLDGNQTFRFNLAHGTLQGDGLYWDQDHREMHVYGNIVYLQSDQALRGNGFLYKIGTQAKNPTSIECYNNIAITCNTGYELISALPDQGKIENNVSVGCRKPMDWRVVTNGKTVAARAPYATGKNMSYDSDPGFVDMAHLNFNLKPGSQLQHDLPGFKPIPVDLIGLQVDQYRRTLPTDREVDRYNTRSNSAGGYDVEDR